MSSRDAQTDAILAGLNDPQREAVLHRDGPLLVIAGPGSGKTRVITRRAACLVHHGVAPRNILAITFTNKAADEMRRRIEQLGVGGGMWVYTFHALGVRLLREFGSLARVAPGFSIYDEADAIRVVKEALQIESVPDTMLRPDEARNRISDAKSRLMTPNDCENKADWFDAATFARVYATYQMLLEQRNAVDFDDLLMKVAVVLQKHPDVTERLNVRFRYVLIDEYQDTNHAQYLIAHALSQHHGNICATGDPDQSIYAWRGADIRNILEFERDYPDARIVRLEQNYRSHGQILAAASRLIRLNKRRKHKDLWTERGQGEPVHVWSFSRGDAEAERIADTIRQMHADGRPYNEFAIFYRINALSRGLEEALRHRGIPYRIARGVEFYNRQEIRDVLAYLRVLVNPADEVALLRIINTPARGIGKTTIDRLRTCANESGEPLIDLVKHPDRVPGLKSAAKRVRAFAELLDQLQPLADAAVSEAVSNVLRMSGLEVMYKEERDTGGEDRLANIHELVTAAARYEHDAEEPSLADFLNRVSLTSDQDAVDEEAGSVMLMTLHAAKGLEFPVVFLVGLEQGLLPHERSLGFGADVEEERRLCFVGITRACEALYLSWTDERMIRGRPTPRPRSQFLFEVDEGDLLWEDFRERPDFHARYSHDSGFEPLVDDLPPDEAARYAPKRRLRRSQDVDTGFTADLDSDAFCEIEPTDSADHITNVDDDSAGPDMDQPEVYEAPTSQLRPRRQKKDPPPPPPVSTWQPGMLIEHEKYGVGTLMLVRPTSQRTSAVVKFVGHGEKTLVLDQAPVRLLTRPTK